MVLGDPEVTQGDASRKESIKVSKFSGTVGK